MLHISSSNNIIRTRKLNFFKQFGVYDMKKIEKQRKSEERGDAGDLFSV